MDSTYLTSAQKAIQLPDYELPEVAFLGRSNSGKSSLINALTNRKNLARESSTPGRTQMANFFKLRATQGKEIILADLPGYGYNVARKEIQNLWNELLGDYLERTNIRYFCFLIDCRRKIDDFEISFLEKLSQKKPLILVLTKTDKSKTKELQKKENDYWKLEESYNLKFSHIRRVSNLKKSGIDKLLSTLLEDE